MFYKVPWITSGFSWESLLEEECLIAGDVARSGGLVVLKSITKYQMALMGMFAR